MDKVNMPDNRLTTEDYLSFTCPALYPLIEGVTKKDKHLIKKTIVNFILDDEYPLDVFNAIIIEESCNSVGLSKWYDESHMGDLVQLKLFEGFDSDNGEESCYKKYPKDVLYEVLMREEFI